MMGNNPRTLDEWKKYIATLSGRELRDKTIAANTMHMVRMLKSEGMSLDMIEELFGMLACRFHTERQQPPGGGLYDLTDLMHKQGLCF